MTGERQQKRLTFPSKREAETAQRDWLTKVERGEVVLDSSLTVRDYLHHWLETSVQHRVRRRTHDNYTQMLNTHVIPALGERRLQALTRAHVERFYAVKLSSGGRADGKAAPLARSVVRSLHTVLKMACTDAVAAGLLTHNPLAGIKPPKPDPSAITVWTAPEVATFLAVAGDGDIYGPIWRVGLHTGLRLSELLGLSWNDVRLDVRDAAGQLRPELRVRQTLDTRFRELDDRTKSAAGVRAVALDPETAAALRTHRALQAERRRRLERPTPPQDLVFLNTTDKPMIARNLARHMDVLIRRAGVSRITPHGMRHTHATVLMLAGVNPKIVSERLGHADVAFTLRIYSHVLPQMQTQAADAFAATIAAARPLAPTPPQEAPGEIPATVPPGPLQAPADALSDSVRADGVQLGPRAPS